MRTRTDVSETVTVDDRGHQLAVPTTFTADDVDTVERWPDFPVDVDRIFRYDDVVRAEARLESGDWVEFGFFRPGDHPHRPRSVPRWHCTVIETAVDEERVDGPGKTLWTRPGLERADSETAD